MKLAHLWWKTVIILTKCDKNYLFQGKGLHLPSLCITLALSNSLFKTNSFNPKYFPMRHEIELQAPATTKVLFKLTIIGCVLLGCVYGFLMLFNSALAAIK